VALEQQMACAMGVCLSCVRLFNEGDTKVFRRVCCEGPVFPLAAVAGEVQFG
jgi:dihydroorotate dehydrogenase electron transfer subunit